MKAFSSLGKWNELWQYQLYWTPKQTLTAWPALMKWSHSSPNFQTIAHPFIQTNSRNIYTWHLIHNKNRLLGFCSRSSASNAGTETHMLRALDPFTQRERSQGGLGVKKVCHNFATITKKNINPSMIIINHDS